MTAHDDVIKYLEDWPDRNPIAELSDRIDTLTKERDALLHRLKVRDEECEQNHATALDQCIGDLRSVKDELQYWKDKWHQKNAQELDIISELWETRRKCNLFEARWKGAVKSLDDLKEKLGEIISAN